MGKSNFILNLHDGFNFPPDILRGYIYENTGITVPELNKITDGYDNEVYDAGGYIVKLRRRGEVPFSCVRWAMDKCREHGVKVPAVVHCGKISGMDIMIEEKIQGGPLVPALYEEAGAELRKIHGIRVDGFWRRHEDGKFDFDRWSDISSNDDRLKEMPLICAGNAFGADDVRYMEDILHAPGRTKVIPVLCHGDYRPDHILCGEKVNGIIDFGDFSGGRIYSDVAYFSLNSDKDNFDSFLKGYGEIDERELIISRIILLMGYLAHSRKIGDEEEAKKLERQLSDIIKSDRVL